MWIHGDLLGGNLLVRDGRLSAVIDWGPLTVADPAPDVAPAWTLFEGEARRLYRERLAVDDATWARARAWVMLPALAGIRYYEKSVPAFSERSRRHLDAVLQDAVCPDHSVTPTAVITRHAHRPVVTVSYIRAGRPRSAYEIPFDGPLARTRPSDLPDNGESYRVVCPTVRASGCDSYRLGVEATRRGAGKPKGWGEPDEQLPGGLRRHRRTSQHRDPLVSIVIPALNEALNLAAVLPQLPKVHEVILVDGGSVDGTVRAARRALPEIVTVLQGRTGKGNALAAGFARVTGDIVVMFDADGSADPAEIARFVDVLKAGADFAKGTRNTAGGGSSDITPVRHVGNRFLNTVFNVGFRARFTDLCYGYNAFWADLIPLLDLPDHAQPARRPAGCCGATASRSRP